MKLKPAITRGVPESIVDAFGSEIFARAFLSEICEKILGAKDPASRPAEYYVQVPDETICVEGYGIEVRLTGVSRSGRKAAQFHAALRDRKSVV